MLTVLLTFRLYIATCNRPFSADVTCMRKLKFLLRESWLGGGGGGGGGNCNVLQSIQMGSAFPCVPPV